MEFNKVYLGDCLEKLKELEDNSIDSIVTDPPYELGFMGKSWDNTGIANNPKMWSECLRVLKPGGHLLAFSGTRTYHRMACAIEDAGFEVRDMIEWVYGSGFPKSLNIGKEVDKLGKNPYGWIEFSKAYKKIVEESKHNHNDIDNHLGIKASSCYWARTDHRGGLPPRHHWEKVKEFIGLDSRYDELYDEVEREILGQKQVMGKDDDIIYGKYKGGIVNITKGTSEWEGWGTALKPSHETIAVAQKPFDSRSDIDYTISICQTLFAQIVKKSSELNLNEKTQQGIAQWIAEKNINTLEDLSEVMDMLQLESEISLNLNIVLSWLNILGEIWGAMSMFTTETKGSLTTELKILQSLEWENIFQNITQVKNNQTSGYSANVLNVENLLNAVKLKLKYILTYSAQENAISQGNKLNFAPNHEPICMARKPLAEKTVALNVLKYGTGGINIDESRVEAPNEDTGRNNKSDVKDTDTVGNWGMKAKDSTGRIGQGRFPANLIHDNSEEVRECFPDAGGGKFTKTKRKRFDGWREMEGRDDRPAQTEKIDNYGDSGNASRFFKSITKSICNNCFDNDHKLCECVECNCGCKSFKSIIYQAKASKSERNKGCEGLEEKPKVFNGQSDKPSEDMKDVEKRFTTLPKANNHPTVKPIALMTYLIKMVTPKGGIVLDPFTGSGSTLVAAKENGFQYIGIEMTPEYIPIIEARLKNLGSKQTTLL